MEMITFTGADERTKIDDLVALAISPHVEIGLLYTAHPQGRNRYPSMDWLLKAATRVSQSGGQVAVHICGQEARAQLLNGELQPLIEQCARVQVNGRIASEQELSELARRVPHLITQHNEHNAKYADSPIYNHCILIDESGGRGITPEAWSVPSCIWPHPYLLDPPKTAFGFAGGLGPDNLAVELPKIQAAAANQSFFSWIDMESKLRDAEDWFDIERAMTCLQILKDFNAVKPQTEQDPQRLREGISRIKLRLHFMGWPTEKHWNTGTKDNPRWIPDWRYEIQLIEHLLNGSPIRTPENPGDTIFGLDVPHKTWSLEQILRACNEAGLTSSQLEHLMAQLKPSDPSAHSPQERERTH
jgi:hypothetical protein